MTNKDGYYIVKLIYCNECHDVVSLRISSDGAPFRTCACGKSGGKYVDRINAVTYGPCIPLGFAGRSFRDARANRKPQDSDDGGTLFTAFVIPENCPSVNEHPNEEPSCNCEGVTR